MNASIECIDFEGRSDGESLRKFVESMKPKQTIVVRGSQESCDRLRHICLSIGKQSSSLFHSSLLHTQLNGTFRLGDSADIKAFIARKGETIDASIENHIYQVRLKDSLLSSLKFAKARNAEVAWIDARLTYQVNIITFNSRFISSFHYLHLSFPRTETNASQMMMRQIILRPRKSFLC